jgi:hypothetical protein
MLLHNVCKHDFDHTSYATISLADRPVDTCLKVPSQIAQLYCGPLRRAGGGEISRSTVEGDALGTKWYPV